jgi:hypothetical protein
MTPKEAFHHELVENSRIPSMLENNTLEEFTIANLIWKLLQYDFCHAETVDSSQHRFSNLAANNEPNFHIAIATLGKLNRNYIIGF